MANIEGMITEDISNTIAPGQTVYDNEGTGIGTVDSIDRQTGYLMVPVTVVDSVNRDSHEVYLVSSQADL